jgi:ankyrin repeat protein
MESKLWAEKLHGTEHLTDAEVKCGVIGLMELARDGELGDFEAKWQKFNLNRGVAFESTHVKFGEQEMELAKLYAKQIQALAELYEDEELARALAKLHADKDEEGARALAELYLDKEGPRALTELYRDEHEEPTPALAKFHEDTVEARAIAKFYKDEEQAQAFAKLYEDAKQARAFADFRTNVKEPEGKAAAWIEKEVRKIVDDVEDGDWRKKKSRNGGQKPKDGAVCNGRSGVGCKGANERVPNPKAKDSVPDPKAEDSVPDGKAKKEVGKPRWHVLKVIRNALPAIYPGRTALHMAAANGNVDIVRVISRVANVDLNTRDVFGYTPLHLACYSTHPRRDEVIKILLGCKDIDANVTAKEAGYYFTPLHLAVKAKSIESVDVLLGWSPVDKSYRKVLDVDTKSNSGWTALHLAVRLKILEKDDEKKDDFKTMIVALIRFINSNIPESINKSDNTKSTPLHTSVAAGDLDLVEILLEDGDKIDPELLDNQRRTALEIAVHQNDYAMVQKIQHYLERAGIVGNHQAFADSASAILVGAALIVTVTFAAWVQIPTNDSTAFWVFISLSFYFAVAAFISAAGAAIPTKGSTLGIIRRAVLVSAFCLAISLTCAVAAFAIAGFIIVPAGMKHKRKVIATTVIGGVVCLFCLLSFVRKILKALGLFFLMLDLVAQKQIVNCISTAVTTILGRSRVKALKNQYKAIYTNPLNEFFKIEEEGDSNSSHGGSARTRSLASENSGVETYDSPV